MMGERSGHGGGTRRALCVIATAGAAVTVLVSAAQAGPGDLDPTFGTNKQWIVSTPTQGSAEALVVQPDGRLVAAGGQSGADFELARYKSDGSLDPTFGTEGRVLTDLSGNDDLAHALVLQPDGKLVVAGAADMDFGLARYNTNGSLDSTFGSGGKVATDIDGQYDVACALVLQPDGKLVAAGGSDLSGGGHAFALVRYNTDGSLDPSFGTGGKVMTTDVTMDLEQVHRLVLQPDGKLVAVGVYCCEEESGDEAVAIVRYNANGTPDSSFGTGGKVFTPIFTYFREDDWAAGLALQPDGRLLVGGQGEGLELRRYNTNGTLDLSFGSGGIVTDPDAPGREVALALQSDGKLVASACDNFGCRLTRYDQANPDPSFGTGGAVVWDDSPDYWLALALQADGKIVVAGAHDGFGLVRFTSTGAVDTGYRLGIATAVFADSAYGLQVAQDGAGRIVVAGGVSTGGLQDFLVARLLADGSLDPSFGSGGAVITNLGGSEIAMALSLLGDGRIVVGGDGYGQAFALARYLPSGGLDGTFDGDGNLGTSFGGDPSGSLRALLEQADGKLVAAGYTLAYPNYRVALARYTGSGSLDFGFDGDGLVTRDLGAGFETAVALAQQPADGKLLVAVQLLVGPDNSDFALLRYNPDGSADTTFGGGDGIATTAIQARYDDPYGMVLLPDGKIVLSGDSDSGATWNVALARFNADGTIDTTFGTGGIVVGPEGTGATVARLRDGRLLVGSVNPGDTQNYLQLSRFTADGVLDLSFGTNGVARVPYGDGEWAYLALQSDGRALIGGAEGDALFVARFLTSYCGPQGPDSSCRASGKSKLLLNKGTTPASDKVVFNWGKGDQTELAELLDPLSTSPYSLCIYDDTGLQLQATAPPGGQCDGVACWSALPAGFKYRDKSDQNDGFHKLLLKTGATGKAKVVASAKGEALPDLASPPPFTGTVAVQLVNEETGTCFAAEFDTASTLQNDAAGFKGKR